MEPEFDLIIEPGGGIGSYWRDLWRYRELFFFMAWRDILVRYKQTVIGVAWSVIRPLMILVVFTVIFGKIARFPVEGNAPYPVMVLAALLPWQLFSNSLSESSNSLILNANMISKVYFPRLIIPASAVIVSLVDFLISFSLLVGVMLWYRFVPGWHILTLPLFLLLALITALGGGLWMSALNVKYRDFRYIIPFIVQFGLYISPVGFSSGVVPDQWRLLYSINPMVGVIDGFRWAILGGGVVFYWPGFFLSLALCLTLFLSGLAFFRRSEQQFADVI
ncbi:ABC transporter permease [Trichloromonas sp.]|uniref:ABC transporter permease n=1 Tax=Trichloromonas sp. TaxID=3069249 RepID=UPI002A39E59A|nr:ABC transporter permease [Trichloromonas sp.]